MSKGYGEMQRIISEQEPEKPSTRARATIESMASVEPGKRLRGTPSLKDLHGDLDWVVMKCLEKDRTRRYETVNGMMADIRCFLNHEPVSAAAPTFSYQFQKFYRRNRSVMRVACGAAAVVLFVSVVSVILAVWANVERKKAQVARQETVEAMEVATQETVKGERLADFMLELVDESVPRYLNNGNVSEATQVMEQMSRQAKDMLALAPRAEYRLRFGLMEYYRYLIFDYAAAARQAERADELLSKLADDQLDRSRLDSQILIANVILMGTEDGSETQNKELRRVQELIREARGLVGAYKQSAAKGLALLGRWYWTKKNFVSSEESTAEAIKLFSPDDGGWLPHYARYNRLQLIEEGHAPDTLIELVRSMPELPLSPSPILSQLLWFEFGWLRIGLTARGELELALDFAEDLARQARRASWPAESMLDVEILQYMILAAMGNTDQALKGVMRIGMDPTVSFGSWARAARIAGGLGATVEYDRLRRQGLRRFAVGVENQFCVELAVVMLSLPGSEDILDEGRILLERLKVSDQRNHYSQARLPLIEAMVAMREERFTDAVKFLDGYEMVQKPSSKLVSVVGNMERVRFERRIVKALALAHLENSDVAITAFEVASELRVQILGKTKPHLLSDAILQEAEQVLRAKGWLGEE